MSTNQPKPPAFNKSAEPKAPSAPVNPAGPPAKVAPLFRSIDWWTLAVTTIVVFLGYWWTLAPDLTLEDCGELAVASMYAGVPHPPGYPVWTIYTWFWTLLPVSNIAYRVALSSAFAGAGVDALALHALPLPAAAEEAVVVVATLLEVDGERAGAEGRADAGGEQEAEAGGARGDDHGVLRKVRTARDD